MKILKKIFGNYSEKEIKKITPLVDKILSLEEDMKKLTDEQLKDKTIEFKERYKNGESLDDMLVEAFAVVSEASSRVLNMRPFRVQLIGGIIIHQGRIAEMKTGEGKTLVATLPIYLNAITGKGVHLITVNDYLAKTGSLIMGKLYKFLGLSVGLVVSNMNPMEKKKAYEADITYGTNNEFGFDYLRDNMAHSLDSMVQRDLNYAIVDEVDSILIDEARTPLIISGSVNKRSDIYEKANEFAKRLKARVMIEKNEKEFDEEDENFDYIIDLKAKSSALTEAGIKKAEEFFNIEDLSDPNNLAISHHINQAVRAYGIMHKDKDYIVKDNEVLIVDEFTGRLMNGRRYSDGLHQAIEAKEGVKIANESQTLATITFQNYFRLYSKLAGMTGTAKTEESEFKGIYKLDVVEIPTNKPVVRNDLNDTVYKSENGKLNAIVEDVKVSYEKGQPVLIGTATIAKSEKLSLKLKAAGIPHQVLNAKYHEQEADIVAQAGKFKSVTIATNMAGRGTDIMLGGNLEYLVKQELSKLGYTKEIIEMAMTPIHYDIDEVNEAKSKIKDIESKYKTQIEESKASVIKAGGLKIIGSERHESRRIDNQLRGRAGRQGDIGSSKFYLSFEDDLMKLFASDKVTMIANMMGLPEDTPIEMGILTSTIETAQKKIEGIHYSIRKNVLEYDDVMNKQREIIYAQRRNVLKSENVKELILNMSNSKIKEIVDMHISKVDNIDDVDLFGINTILTDIFKIENLLSKEEISNLDEEYISNLVYDKVKGVYEFKHNQLEAKDEAFKDLINSVEKGFILRTVDEKWMDHIDNISGLKDGINLRAYGQTNPLEAYKVESFDLFEEMNYKIKEDSLKAVFSIKQNTNNVNTDNDVKITNYVSDDSVMENRSKITNITTNAPKENIKQEPVKVNKEQGRNEMCSCGSGLKFKNCCLKNK